MKPSFDRLAGIYRALEFLAFGGDLERARFCLLERLAGSHSILILGEGDGRCLARLVELAPAAQIHCVDISAAMLAQTAGRLSPANRERVRLECADALKLNFPPQTYDAVVTLFFLDCFTAPEVERLVTNLNAALRPDGLWLFADFVMPPPGWRRARARMWLGVLYAFFQWQTKLSARSLPPSETLLIDTGLRPTEIRNFQHGLLRAVLFRR